MQTQLKTAPVSVKITKTKNGDTKRARKPKHSKPKKAGFKQTKTAKILALLRRPNGTTINELCKATGWQAHSVRGFLSGTVRRKLGLKVTAETNDKGIRRYWIDSTPDKTEA